MAFGQFGFPSLSGADKVTEEEGEGVETQPELRESPFACASYCSEGDKLNEGSRFEIYFGDFGVRDFLKVTLIRRISNS